MSKKAKKEKQKSTFWKDFKAFISRGNIVDLAVAVVVGAAFTAIVNSFVNDIITPLISLLINGDMSELVAVLRPEQYEIVDGVKIVTQEAITLNYGNLIMAILTFLIDAFVIFTAIRIVRNAQRKLKEGAEALKDKLIKEECEGKALEEAAQEATAVEAAPEAPAAPAEPPKPSTEELLAEIRDLLKQQQADVAEKKSDAEK